MARQLERKRGYARARDQRQSKLLCGRRYSEFTLKEAGA